MWYVMEERGHHCAVPNSGVILRGESDVLSVTPRGLFHEWEIKLSQSDFTRDFRTKRAKHLDLDRTALIKLDNRWIPCYFWFVTHGFEIDRETFPAHAGLALYDPDGRDGRGEITIEIPAPRLSGRRVNGRDHKRIARLLSFRLKNELNKRRRN